MKFSKTGDISVCEWRYPLGWASSNSNTSDSHTLSQSSLTLLNGVTVYLWILIIFMPQPARRQVFLGNAGGQRKHRTQRRVHQLRQQSLEVQSAAFLPCYWSKEVVMHKAGSWARAHLQKDTATPSKNSSVKGEMEALSLLDIKTLKSLCCLMKKKKTSIPSIYAWILSHNHIHT